MSHLSSSIHRLFPALLLIAAIPSLSACSRSDDSSAPQAKAEMRNTASQSIVEIQLQLGAGQDAEAIAHALEQYSAAQGARISVTKEDAAPETLKLELVAPQKSSDEIRQKLASLVPNLDTSAVAITELDNVGVQDLDPELHEAAHLDDPAAAKQAVEALLSARGEQGQVDISEKDGHREIKIHAHRDK